MSPQLLSGAARLAGSSLLRLQSDERLVALVRDGHDPAFSAVVDRYRGELLRYATRVVGDSRAEDVVQQAFVNAHQAMTSSDSDIKLRPWLYRITHNAALNALRAGRRAEELDDRLAAAGGVEQTVEHRERLREALAAIARLPEPQRDALTLQALQGRSHEEIAAALNVSSGAARQQVHRARGAVRAAVSAVTPYGLLARYAMAGGGEPASAVVTGAGAAGITATVGKIGAGVLAAGAIATGTTGHVPFVGHAAKHRPVAAQPAHSGDDDTVAAASAGTTEDVADDHGGRRSSGNGRRGGSGSSDKGRDDHGRGKDKHGGATSGDDSRHGSDDSGRQSGDDSASSGSGDRSGSGSSRHGSDDAERSGSHTSGSSGSSGDDGREGSGKGSGSSGSGSDDVITAPATSDGAHSGSEDGASLSGGSGTSGGDDGRSGSGSGSSGSGSGSSGGGSGTSGSGGGDSGGGGSDDGLPDD
jgi:RNA polymerase sigma factor (sigma-70 family)